MTIKTFLTIVAALGIVHGVAFLVAPNQVVRAYGIVPSAPIALMSRFFGGALLAWCAILWSAKSFRDEAAVRAVLLATCVAEAIGVLTAIAGTVAGTMNGLGWMAVAIYAFGSVGCAYFLTGQKRLAAAS
jgi:hypothetical protein